MKKVFVILLCIIALLFVACELDELKTPDGESTPSQGDGGGGSSQSGTGEGGSGGDSGQHNPSGGDSGDSGSQDPLHEHTYAEAWTSDWTYHWHASTCGHDTTYAKGYHTYVAGVCSVCGFEEPKVGQTGPAGGIIFYDQGNYTGGWRFLEAAPADLRVVNEVPTVDSSTPGYATAERYYAFGYYISPEGDQLFSNGKTTNAGTEITQTGLGQGKRNTQMLVAVMGEETYKVYDSYNPENSKKVTNYAARLCDILEYGGYDDWFLPSYSEAKKMYDNLKDLKLLGSFHCTVLADGENETETYGGNRDWYWTSSELSTDAGKAYFIPFSTGNTLCSANRSYGCRIRPVRSF